MIDPTPVDPAAMISSFRSDKGYLR